MKKIAIIGAGPVGCTAALILSRLGYKITLIESYKDILRGGGCATANIHHSDGFEYYKRGHYSTGESCVDGSIMKALLFPTESFDSHVCTSELPIRFMVSNKSCGVDGLTRSAFVENVNHLRQRFKLHFDHLLSQLKIDSSLLGRMLRRTPSTFARELKPEEMSDCEDVSFGYAGSGTGIDMGAYYAFLKTCIGRSEVELHLNQTISSIGAISGGRYLIKTESASFEIDSIALTCAHSIPHLINLISANNIDVSNAATGTYFLNAMTYVKLPATKSSTLLNSASRINFILQGEGGAMFACIIPPSLQSDGYGAVYYPSPKGSQIHRHLFFGGDPVSLELQWENYTQGGIQLDGKRVSQIMAQAFHYYPFLRGYAEPCKVICRSVFNAATCDSNLGLERRVREIIKADIITHDGRITAYRSPKWTNAELVGAMAADHVASILGGPTLPKCPVAGLGPTSIDGIRLAAMMDFRDTPIESSWYNNYRNYLGFSSSS